MGSEPHKHSIQSSPISRILSSPETGGGGHLSSPDIAAWVKRPTRSAIPTGRNIQRVTILRTSPQTELIWSCSRRGLSYSRHHCRKGGLLPHHCTFACVPTRRDHRPCIFCDTFRRVTPPPRYGASCPVEFGLSSSRHVGTRPPGLLWIEIFFCRENPSKS